MPHSSASLQPIGAGALAPRPAPAKENASLHPASQHSLAARPAPVARAHSEGPVVLTPAPDQADSRQLHAPVFAQKPAPAEEDWTALLADPAPDEEDAEEPLEDFAKILPEPVSVPLLEQLPAPKKRRWPWVTAGVCLAAAAAVIGYFGLRG